jgi:Tetratricopeptide repeat
MTSLAWWTGMAGDAERAVQLHHEVLSIRERVSGTEHPATWSPNVLSLPARHREHIVAEEARSAQWILWLICWSA